MLKYEILKEKYNSPRVTGEVMDCSMPMTFDQHNNCGFNCLYCFSTFQRATGASEANYLAKKVKQVSVERFKRYFTELDDPKNPFRDIIKNRITMQFGGLSDPFCPIEEQTGVGYQILSFLKEIKYPVCFSSKSDLLLRDPKYLKLFEGMQDLWSYKASIITLDEEKAKVVEAGVPSPQRRLEVLRRLSEMGIWTILRLRPFIIGLSDLTYEELIKTAGEYGVKAMSTEFFCLELRSVNKAKAKYEALSEVLGFDVVNYYKNISPGSGYLRLNYSIKEKYINRMEEICREYGMNFHVSDAHHKEKGASGSCCGLPANGPFKFSKCQFTYALWFAKKNGQVTWSDIAEKDVWLKSTGPLKAPGFNTGNSYKRNKKCDVNFYDYLRNEWNSPKSHNSPYKYFGGILIPVGLDKNKDVIYKFNYDKAKLAETNLEQCRGCMA